jgi:hypothetical protein
MLCSGCCVDPTSDRSPKKTACSSLDISRWVSADAFDLTSQRGLIIDGEITYSTSRRGDMSRASIDNRPPDAGMSTREGWLACALVE